MCRGMLCTQMFENDVQPMGQGSQKSVFTQGGVCPLSFPKLGSRALWWLNPDGFGKECQWKAALSSGAEETDVGLSSHSLGREPM